VSSALDLVDVRVDLGGKTVVDGVTLSFERDRRHAVIGRSGAGKSVLMKAAAGLLPLSSGRVEIHAQPLVFVHQDPALLDTLTVHENVAFAVERTKLTRAEVVARVDDVVARLDLANVLDRAPASLPIAIQKRVSLARALALAPGVLVVDEPTTGLDPIAAQQVDDALASLSGTTLIVITHSPRTLLRLAPAIVVVADGRATRSAA
jgi:ABC-type multidrug transport system ATPase subunit